MVKFSKILCAIPFLCGCVQMMEKAPEVEPDSCVRTVEFRIDDILTRSSLKTSENRVDNLNLYAYCNGQLENSVYWSGQGTIEMALRSESPYEIYALANVGRLAGPESEKDIEKLRINLNGLHDLDAAFPMSWHQHINSASTGLVYVNLVRLVSKVEFSFDAGELPELKVTSVKLCQSAMDVGPFIERSSATKVSDGDYASASDIAKLNSGGTVFFYTLENCRGSLLRGNLDPWAKIPANISSDSSLSTYLEVSCVPVGSATMSGTLKYRMYLGHDNVTNFDIERNTVQKVTLFTTCDGLGHESWKIDCSSFSIRDFMEFEPPVLNMVYGDVDTVRLRTSVADYDLETVGFEELGLSLRPLGGNDYELTCECWYEGGGTGRLKAKGGGLSAECVIDVDNVPIGIHTPGDIVMAAGERREVMIYPLPYEVDFHYMCDCESSNPSVAVIDGCNFNTYEIMALKGGTTTVTVSFYDLEATFTITVTDRPVPLTDIKVPSYFDVPFGTVRYCRVGLVPSDATDGITAWSSDESVATVREAGPGLFEIQGKKAGRVQISLSTERGIERKFYVFVTIAARFFMAGNEAVLYVQDAGQGTAMASIDGEARVCSTTHHTDLHNVPRNPKQVDRVFWSDYLMLSPGETSLSGFSRLIDSEKVRAESRYEDNYVWTDIVAGYYYITRSYYYVEAVSLDGSTIEYDDGDLKVAVSY